MIYCNTDWYDNKLDWSKMTGYDVWLARYGDTILAPDKKSTNIPSGSPPMVTVADI